MSTTAFSAPVTPFGGWVAGDRVDRLVPLETAPHILGLAPPGTGKTRRWLAQSAVLWPGPAVVSSSKDDLMQLVASRRWGSAMLVDLRPITPPTYPRDFVPCRYDPTALIETLEDAQASAETLLSMSSVGFGGAQARPAADNGMWENLAFAPLTCLLYAASPAATGRGMPWVLEAAEDVSTPQSWPHGVQVSTDPSWVTAALWTDNPLFEARVRGVLAMVDKQRDSVKMTVTKSLTAWLRTSTRDRTLPPLDPAFLDDAAATLYVLSPSDGTVAPLAVTLMEQLIRRQRLKVAQWEQYPQVGMFLDELPNTPLPKILQYFAEARGLGVAICAAAQASSQLDVVYGALQGRAIRDVVPATLIMYGAHEEELMRAAAFWAGKTTRSRQSYDHNHDSAATTGDFGNALEPEELSPRNVGQARLLVRGTPGRLVELIEWSDFVPYLDELRGARDMRRR
ncbi:type IV secretory system conjugative DNA transfer family protein [Mycolicibacterium sp. P1-18]|uniref:type IV secretory system conjugative DNA transfer family protein n=1 Tax=Mycolicibacterium sp. P1-18 TaxID=2024615 RepID=UPI0011F0A0B3|nr:TraM recognition domain-containing protein [Mycolicibacterium sp. P1-18]KAA0093587.1 type IV secretory system conjugative DNA transfer family protein [Mycolicibacterium sp. P1-18]